MTEKRRLIFPCPKRASVCAFFRGVLTCACSELKGSRLPRGNREGGECNHWPDVMAFLHLALELFSRYWDDAHKVDSRSVAVPSFPISSIRPSGNSVYDILIFLDESASIFCTEWGTGLGGDTGQTNLTVSQCTGKLKCAVTESLISYIPCLRVVEWYS